MTSPQRAVFQLGIPGQMPLEWRAEWLSDFRTSVEWWEMKRCSFSVCLINPKWQLKWFSTVNKGSTKPEEAHFWQQLLLWRKRVPWGWQGTSVISAGTMERNTVGKRDIPQDSRCTCRPKKDSVHKNCRPNWTCVKENELYNPRLSHKYIFM